MENTFYYAIVDLNTNEEIIVYDRGQALDKLEELVKQNKHGSWQIDFYLIIDGEPKFIRTTAAYNKH